MQCAKRVSEYDDDIYYEYVPHNKPRRCVKIFDAELRTHNRFQWTEDVEARIDIEKLLQGDLVRTEATWWKNDLCSPYWFHAYDVVIPETALFFNHMHLAQSVPRLFVCEYWGWVRYCTGTKIGVTNLKPIFELDVTKQNGLIMPNMEDTEFTYCMQCLLDSGYIAPHGQPKYRITRLENIPTRMNNYYTPSQVKLLLAEATRMWYNYYHKDLRWNKWCSNQQVSQRTVNKYVPYGWKVERGMKDVSPR